MISKHCGVPLQRLTGDPHNKEQDKRLVSHVWLCPKCKRTFTQARRKPA